MYTVHGAVWQKYFELLGCSLTVSSCQLPIVEQQQRTLLSDPEACSCRKIARKRFNKPKVCYKACQITQTTLQDERILQLLLCWKPRSDWGLQPKNTSQLARPRIRFKEDPATICFAMSNLPSSVGACFPWPCLQAFQHWFHQFHQHCKRAKLFTSTAWSSENYKYQRTGIILPVRRRLIVKQGFQGCQNARGRHL